LGESPGTLFFARCCSRWHLVGGGVVGASSGALNDQHRRLVGIVVSLSDHSQRAMAERDHIA
jgi:hypothetical protein